MQLLADNRLIDLTDVCLSVEDKDIVFHTKKDGQHIKPIHCITTGKAFAIWSLIESAKNSGDGLFDLSLHNI